MPYPPAIGRSRWSRTLFENIRQTLLPNLAEFQELGYSIARTDVLSSLATLAIDRRWCRPSDREDRVLTIVDGRHPVLERQLGNSFVANDTSFDADDSLQLDHRPQHGRQKHLHPPGRADHVARADRQLRARQRVATLGLVDRLFARIGASDELHTGQSTFMVEMTETANILNNATPDSLVVLDEIGRGTSTLDGLSLAWAIAEHIAGESKCRTLFATHYHELTDLSQRYTGVKNFNVSVREWDDQVDLPAPHRRRRHGPKLRHPRSEAGRACLSSVLERARQLLGELAVQRVGKLRLSRGRKGDDANQLPLFVDPSVELAMAMNNLDVNALTPMAAFELLRQWKEKFGK